MGRMTLLGAGSANSSAATKFIIAAGITDQTQKTAIINLEKNLKIYSIFNKMNAVYPFVGGSDNSHKFNLIDPRDDDSAYRITWFGGMTHDSNGITGNGVNAWGLTHLNNASLTANNKHVSYYQRNDLGAYSGITMGAGDSESRFQLSYASSNYSCLNTAQSPYSIVGVQKGFLAMNKTVDGFFDYNQNSNATITIAGATLNQPYDWVIMTDNAHNAPAVANISFATIGAGLTPTEMTNLNSVVEIFQTELGRNV